MTVPPEMRQKINEYLKRINADPRQQYIQLQNPNDGQQMVVKNPNYNPNLVDPETESNDQKEQADGSWCSITKNYCPESTECVWWIPDEEDEDEGGCSQVTQVLSSIEAENAKAEFYKNATEAVKAMLTANNGSALASLMDKLTTKLQLDNEKIFSEESSNKKPDKKVPIAKKEVIVNKEEEETEEFEEEKKNDLIDSKNLPSPIVDNDKDEDQDDDFEDEEFLDDEELIDEDDLDQD